MMKIPLLFHPLSISRRSLAPMQGSPLVLAWFWRAPTWSRLLVYVGDPVLFIHEADTSVRNYIAGNNGPIIDHMTMKKVKSLLQITENAWADLKAQCVKSLRTVRFVFGPLLGGLP